MVAGLLCKKTLLNNKHKKTPKNLNCIINVIIIIIAHDDVAYNIENYTKIFLIYVDFWEF